MFRKNPVFPARILIYVLGISTVIATIIGALIVLNTIRQSQYQLLHQEKSLLNNVDSGIELLLDLPNHTASKTIFDLYNTTTDSIIIEKKYWGVYTLGHLTAIKHTIQGRRLIHKDLLLGGDLLDEQKSALYLTGINTPLFVGGTTQIRGDAYLPISGIKAAMINGVNYKGNKLLYGKKKNNTRFLPPRNKALIDSLLYNFQYSAQKTNFEQYKIYSFGENARIISGQDIYLDGLNLKGNIIVKADSTVIISANNKIEDILVFAPKVIIESGFKGNLQVFAKKEITVEENVFLNYPSALVLFKDLDMTDLIQPKIAIGKQCKIQGVIWLEELKINRTKGLVSIDENTLIEGQIIANGFVDLKGSVYGNISCTGFFLKTAASVYENHLFNATIDANQLNPYFISHVIFEDSKSNKIIKWLK